MKISSKRTQTKYVKMTSPTSLKKKKIFVEEKSIAQESYMLLKSSLQISLSMIFEVCVATITQMFLGQLENSSQIVAARQLAGSFVLSTAAVMCWGFASALWSLIPQAVGSNNTHLIALYSQRGFLISILIEIPFSIMLLYSKNILMFFGINADGNIDWNIVTTICNASIPYPYLMVTLSILHRIAQNVDLNFEIFIVHAITFFLSIPLNYLFITVFNMNYIGGPLVYSSTLLLSIILMVLLLINKGYSYVFKPLDWNLICDKKGLYQYMQLGFPGCIQWVLIWLFRAAYVFLAGYMSNTAVAVSIVAVMNSLKAPLLFHHGMANAFTIRIGQYIGANKIYYAKRVIKIQICFTVFLIILIGIITMIYICELTTLYTNSPIIIELISNKLLYILLIDGLLSSIYRQLSGVYRAIAYPKITVYVSIIAQYLIGLPLVIYFLFWCKFYDNIEMGISTIWIGFAFGYLLAFIILVAILKYYISWNKVIQASQLRIAINNKTISKNNYEENKEFDDFKQLLQSIQHNNKSDKARQM